MKLRLSDLFHRWLNRARTGRKSEWCGLAGAGLWLAAGTLAVRTARADSKPATETPTAPTVAVARVSRQNLFKEVTIQAEFRPYQEIDLHAKVAGFLKDMRVDIGDRVQAGQLLAVIEVPELQDDITHAEATLHRSQDAVRRAEAESQATHLVYGRLAAVEKSTPNLVAQQDIDAAQSKDLSTAAALAEARSAVDVAKADVAKLQTLQTYTRIAAPFEGVITKRYADPGALIPGGTTSSQITPLVRLSENNRLRLAFPVSMTYVSQIQAGQVVQVRVPTLDKSFAGKVSRFNRKVDTATRTMDVEVDVPNADLVLVPGMYASVLLELNRREKALVVPVTAVSRKGAPTVYVVDKNGEIQERKVKLGLETPTMLEVLEGLSENDMVLVGSRSQIQPGQKVAPRLVESGPLP